MNFDRFDILSAYNLYSALFAGDSYTAGIQARLAGLKYQPARSEERFEGLSENAQAIFSALVLTHQGEDAAEQVRREYQPEIGDATVKLVTSEEDPTRISVDVFYEFAEQWADAVGSTEGSTWESTGDRGFVYDIWQWRPGIIADLVKEGFKLDLSEYSEPSEDEIATAIHAHECEACQYEYRKAEQHRSGAAS